MQEKVIYEEVPEDIVILSPSLYWYKLCSIPTRNFSKAKNIAEHMMSDRPSNFGEIVLYKNNDNYDAYAYEKIFIKNLLKELGLKNPKVYFANQLQVSDKTSIDEQKALYSFNGRIMEYTFGEEQPSHSLKHQYKELLHGEKHLKAFEKRNNNNTSYLLVSLAFFSLYVLFFSIEKIQTLQDIERELESLPTQERSFHEIRSLIRKYTKLESSSVQLQKELQNALKEEQIKTLVYENGSIKVTR